MTLNSNTFRCRILCCCCVGRDEQSTNAYSGIADIMTMFFQVLNSIQLITFLLHV